NSRVWPGLPCRSPRLSVALMAPALAASTLWAISPSTRSSLTGRTRVAVFVAGALVVFTTNCMVSSPQDKESALQDNAGLVFGGSSGASCVNLCIGFQRLLRVGRLRGG